jgi:tyrosinase
VAGSMIYRSRVAGANAAHMSTYREAMAAAQAINDNRGYNYIAGFHGAPGWYCWHHQANPRTPLQARVFLAWHRAYLLWLEFALRDRVASSAIPWWDWTVDRRIPAVFDARRIDNQPNPLYSSRAIVPNANPPIRHNTRRAPGANRAASLPTADEVNAVVNQSDWATFSDQVEDLHDRVHGWVGGDMADVTTAAYDPIFFSHHAMVDRLWSIWQVKFGNGGIPHELLDTVLTPFHKTFRDVLDVQRLGYEYAVNAVLVPVE